MSWTPSSWEPEVSDANSAPRITRAVQWIIAINVAVYFLQLTVLRAEDVQLALGFQRNDLGRHWWTTITYMFVHGGFWHLALNMYTLWLFGPRVEWRWGAREFVVYYLICGLGGWFAHLAFVPGDTLLIGASAAVFGVMLAYATFWPDEQVLVFGVIPTTVRWLVIFVAVTNLVSGMASDGASGVAYLAHMGGLAAGWLYLRATGGKRLSLLRRPGVSSVPDEPEDELPRAIPKASRTRVRDHADDAVARSKAVTAKRAVSRPAARVEPASSDNVALDRVLDKILAKGIDSLSPEELRLLDEESRRRRNS